MWANPQEPEDLVLFTEGILNEKLHFLCSVASIVFISYGEMSGMIFLELKKWLKDSN